jgi:tetratricopeptide (TPR) repeat protein
MVDKLIAVLFFGFAPLLASCFPSSQEGQRKQIHTQQGFLERQRLIVTAWEAESNEDYDTAIRLLTTAIETEHDPKEKAAMYGSRAVAYAHALRFDQALTDFDTSLDLDPNQDYPHMWWGTIYIRRNGRL